MGSFGHIVRSIIIFMSMSLSALAYESTNIQFLYSDGFNGNALIYDTVDGKKSTITFEHYRTWALGDLYMFVDLMDGKKLDGNTSFAVYTEIAPRFSFSKMTDSAVSFGVFTDFYLATQIDQGNDYQALLLGLGTDISMPGFEYSSLDFYWRSTNIANDTYQVTVAYRSNELLHLHLEGSIDVTSRVINTQNQLLWDVGSFITKVDELYAGTEWLYYDHNNNGTSAHTNVWQLMLKYRF